MSANLYTKRNNSSTVGAGGTFSTHVRPLIVHHNQCYNGGTGYRKPRTGSYVRPPMLCNKKQESAELVAGHLRCWELETRSCVRPPVVGHNKREQEKKIRKKKAIYVRLPILYHQETTAETQRGPETQLVQTVASQYEWQNIPTCIENIIPYPTEQYNAERHNLGALFFSYFFCLHTKITSSPRLNPFLELHTPVLRAD